MSNFPIPEWSAQVDDAQFTDPAAVQNRTQHFERTIRRRNRLENAAGFVCLVVFAAFGLGALSRGEFLIAVADALCVIGVLVVTWQLRRRANLLPMRPEAPCLDHLRAQYERQYRALRSVPKWYLGPLIPGIAAFYAAVTVRVAQSAGWARALEGLWLPLGFTVAVFVAIAFANWLAARALKRRIDQIDALD